MDSIIKLLKDNPKDIPNEQKTEQDVRARAKCQITIEDLSKIISHHLFRLGQCQADNAVGINIKLSIDFINEVAEHTIRLNPTTITTACTKAKVFTKTGKPIDSITSPCGHT